MPEGFEDEDDAVTFHVTMPDLVNADDDEDDEENEDTIADVATVMSSASSDASMPALLDTAEVLDDDDDDDKDDAHDVHIAVVRTGTATALIDGAAAGTVVLEIGSRVEVSLNRRAHLGLFQGVMGTVRAFANSAVFVDVDGTAPTTPTTHPTTHPHVQPYPGAADDEDDLAAVDDLPALIDDEDSDEDADDAEDRAAAGG